ncbi:MAG: SURF1 family cytochrome oxidase biogenesis protein [Brevundimonas sp.]|uniref:SURF1 family protein n=1 Tax=Brevundimonas sp. TaxID=1871086 RepID=UPI00271D746E|nr:SURF1 family cytochrome oxidase biogenesis protein [Brevundimonas sp.]MDO9609048.1 SURF1 family cytochrome oxidase biogenesis protein [Brevundimonas sp.]
MRRFPWILTVLTVAALVLLIGLGVWQVERLKWKEGLIAASEAAAAKPPAPLDQVLGEGDLEFRKALIVCPGLATAPYVELQSIHDGEVGVRLISACRPAEAEFSLLIDRGFIADGVSERPRVIETTLPLVLIGEFRSFDPPSGMTPAPANGRFYGRDTAAMAEALKVQGPVRPEAVFAVTPTNPEFAALRPSAPPAAFSNNHFGYALTWFGLAIVLAGFYVALLRRRTKKDIP